MTFSLSIGLHISCTYRLKRTKRQVPDVHKVHKVYPDLFFHKLNHVTNIHNKSKLELTPLSKKYNSILIYLHIYIVDQFPPMDASANYTVKHQPHMVCKMFYYLTSMAGPGRPASSRHDRSSFQYGQASTKTGLSSKKQQNAPLSPFR